MGKPKYVVVYKKFVGGEESYSETIGKHDFRDKAWKQCMDECRERTSSLRDSGVHAEIRGDVLFNAYIEHRGEKESMWVIQRNKERR